MSLNARVGKTYPRSTAWTPEGARWAYWQHRYPHTARLMGRA